MAVELKRHEEACARQAAREPPVNQPRHCSQSRLHIFFDMVIFVTHRTKSADILEVSYVSLITVSKRDDPGLCGMMILPQTLACYGLRCLAPANRDALVFSAVRDREAEMASEVVAIARSFASERFPDRPVLKPAEVRVPLSFCRRVATYFDEVSPYMEDERVRDGYEAFQRESLHQFETIRQSGFRIEPWLGEGQPYQNSRDLRQKVLQSKVLHVFMTRNGHGQDTATSENTDSFYSDHPMRKPSGIEISGEEFLCNDIFRAVHDFFGHVMHGNSFQLGGEFCATFDHFRMYSREIWPVLFAETLGQLCWFFCGPHLDQDGRLPRRGEPGYIPPAHRPYSEQKVFIFPDSYLLEFQTFISDPLVQDRV